MESSNAHGLREPTRRMVAHFVPIVASLAFVVGGLGLTCQEYLDLPPAGEDQSPLFNQTGFWDLGTWTLNYKGDVSYDAYWLGYVANWSGELRNPGWWEIVSSRLMIGASQTQLSTLLPQGFDFVMSVKLDVYGDDNEDQQWDKLTVEEQFGGSYDSEQDFFYIPHPCPPGTPMDAFSPASDWFVICGEIPEKQSSSGSVNLHANYPYGKLHLFVGVNRPDTCLGLLGICSSEDWMHRIP